MAFSKAVALAVTSGHLGHTGPCRHASCAALGKDAPRPLPELDLTYSPTTRVLSGGEFWPSQWELSRYLKYMARARISEFELCKPLRLDELGGYAQDPPQTAPVGIERLASSREQKSATHSGSVRASRAARSTIVITRFSIRMIPARCHSWRHLLTLSRAAPTRSASSYCDRRRSVRFAD